LKAVKASSEILKIFIVTTSTVNLQIATSFGWGMMTKDWLGLIFEDAIKMCYFLSETINDSN
jgi:hypothetical protein